MYLQYVAPTFLIIRKWAKTNQLWYAEFSCSEYLSTIRTTLEILLMMLGTFYGLLLVVQLKNSHFLENRFFPFILERL